MTMTSGRVMLSLTTTAAADSLCSLREDGTVQRHLTSVSCSKVRYKMPKTTMSLKYWKGLDGFE